MPTKKEQGKKIELQTSTSSIDQPQLRPITFQINNTTKDPSTDDQSNQAAYLSSEEIQKRLKKLNDSSVNSVLINKFDLKGFLIYLNWHRGSKQDEFYQRIVNCIRNCQGTVTNILPCPFAENVGKQVNFLVVDWDRESLSALCDSYTNWRDSTVSMSTTFKQIVQKPLNLTKRQALMISTKENVDLQNQTAQSQTKIDVVQKFKRETPEWQEKFQLLLYVLLKENCILLRYSQMGKLLEKLTYMSLSFFSPNHYKTKQMQDLSAPNLLSLVSSEAVFCIKSFAKGINSFQMHIFDYRDNNDKQLDIPKFITLDRLPLPFSPFQSEDVLEQLQDEYTRHMNHYKKNVEKLKIKRCENEINTPIPKHHFCGLCQKEFQDYRNHISCDEHRALTLSQTDYLNDIDTILNELNAAVAERLKEIQVKVPLKKLIYDDSTDFFLAAQKQQSSFAFHLNMQQTASRTPAAEQQQKQTMFKKTFFSKRIIAPVTKQEAQPLKKTDII